MTSGNREKLKEFFKRPFGDDSDAPSPSEIIVVSPYISRDALEDVLSVVEDWKKYPHVTIICSWRTRDLVTGASDIGVYEPCRNGNWILRVDHDRSPRKIHLKAYVAYSSVGDNFVGQGMIGSANLTNRGLDSNVEYLHPVGTAMIDAGDGNTVAHNYDFYRGEWGGPYLKQSLQEAFEGSIVVDEEAYQSMKMHLAEIGTREPESLPNWTPPVRDTSGDIPVGNRQIAQVMHAMPPRPCFEDLVGIKSLGDAINLRGLRFGQIRDVVSTDTKKFMMQLISSDPRLDIQKKQPGGTSECLVWRLQDILNEEIQTHLEHYYGRMFRELGLPPEHWERSQRGGPKKIANDLILGLLPRAIQQIVENLRTWEGTIALLPSGEPKENRPVGPRYTFDDLPTIWSDPPFLPDLWLPTFCIYEAEKGAPMGDLVFRGFGFWEPTFDDVEAMKTEFEDDVKLVQDNLNVMRDGDSSFLPKEGERDWVFMKVRAGKGVGHLSLGHPKRPLTHYLTKDALSKIVRGIV